MKQLTIFEIPPLIRGVPKTGAAVQLDEDLEKQRQLEAIRYLLRKEKI